ncbi:MAG TPA: hypothetical protein VHK67_05715 [Rhabdochlamydiaceae bacterium]|nr:hypothetical protein [Rhabdochlamydiaceae bacterium]
MNFTREPLIETVIVPREGCRLILRSSRNESQEEFTVDAVEIVSFGPALFYRSLEKPRPFLVPVGDYEVVEVKESRVVLKNAQFERTIKIGGGREGSLRKDEEEEQLLPAALEDEIAGESEQLSHDKKRDRGRRNRRRRPSDERDDMRHRAEETQEFKPAPPKEAQHPKEPQVVPSFSHLIPPPTTLISQNIQKYKDQQSGNLPPQEELPPEEPPKEEETDSNSISRVAVEQKPLSLQSTQLDGWNHFLT